VHTLRDSSTTSASTTRPRKRRTSCPLGRHTRTGHVCLVRQRGPLWPSRPRLGIADHPRGRGCHMLGNPGHTCPFSLGQTALIIRLVVHGRARFPKRQVRRMQLHFVANPSAFVMLSEAKHLGIAGEAPAASSPRTRPWPDSSGSSEDEPGSGQSPSPRLSFLSCYGPNATNARGLRTASPRGKEARENRMSPNKYAGTTKISRAPQERKPGPGRRKTGNFLSSFAFSRSRRLRWRDSVL